MRLMADTVASVAPAEGTKWRNRIILGCWAVSVSLPIPQNMQLNKTGKLPSTL